MTTTAKDTGTLARWFDERGFGFLKPDSGSADVFVHIRDLQAAGLQEPSVGDRFRYEISAGKDGRTKAASLEAVAQN